MDILQKRKEISRAYKPFRKALSEWIRVIHALIYRETKTAWGQYSLGIIWSFVEPLTHIGVMYLMRYVILGKTSSIGMSDFMFLATGIFSFFVFRDCVNKIKSCVNANRALLAFPQIRLLDFALARSFLQLSSTGTTFFLIIIICWWIGSDKPINIFPIVSGFIMMWLFGTAIGILVIPMHNRFKIFDQIVTVCIRILYFTSGVMYSLVEIPHKYQYYLSYIPTFHGIEYVRSGFSNIYGEVADIAYLGIWTLFSITIGLLLLRHLKHYILNQP